jgi:hypothetical protein
LDKDEILASIQRDVDRLMIDVEHSIEWKFERLRNAVAILISIMAAGERGGKNLAAASNSSS